MPEPRRTAAGGGAGRAARGGKLREAGADGGRFAVNRSLGLLGLFDVASKLGIQQYTTDLGITLGLWGMEPGPYLVLPLLGPSSVRDGVGRGGDAVLHPLFYVEDETTQWGLRGVEVVDHRADLLEVEELISGDRYTFLRDLYLQRRSFLVSSAYFIPRRPGAQPVGTTTGRESTPAGDHPQPSSTR